MGDSPKFVETNVLVTDKALGDIVVSDLYLMLGVEKPDRWPVAGWCNWIFHFVADSYRIHEIQRN